MGGDKVGDVKAPRAAGKAPAVEEVRETGKGVQKKLEEVSGEEAVKEIEVLKPNSSKKNWASVVSGNRNSDMCMKLKYIPPNERWSSGIFKG